MPEYAQVNTLSLGRCPHCHVASPALVMMTQTDICIGAVNREPRRFGLWQCTSCGNCVADRINDRVGYSGKSVRTGVWPTETIGASEAIPEPARRYLQQAIDSISTPDGAVMLAASAILSMHKAKKYNKSKLFEAIKLAVADNALTPELEAWAHKLRLDSNDPRHADDDHPHKTTEEAKELVEFARMLGEIWFVLPAKILKKQQLNDKSKSQK